MYLWNWNSAKLHVDLFFNYWGTLTPLKLAIKPTNPCCDGSSSSNDSDSYADPAPFPGFSLSPSLLSSLNSPSTSFSELCMHLGKGLLFDTIGFDLNLTYLQMHEFLNGKFAHWALFNQFSTKFHSNHHDLHRESFDNNLYSWYSWCLIQYIWCKIQVK